MLRAFAHPTLHRSSVLIVAKAASAYDSGKTLEERSTMADVLMAERNQTRTDGKVRFFGVHHLALNTDDMKMTVDFYVGVLGMRLVHAMKVPPGLGTGPGNRGNPPFEEVRHYFFDMGRDGLLAFFEMPKGKKQQGDRNALGAMQHVSFAVSPDSQKRICEQLKAAKVAFDGPMEILPGIFSIYVFDPNDIRLEFSCQPSNGEGEPEIVPLVTQSKDEALRELKTLTGDKGWLDRATAGLTE
jgi:catechol 2,3-dioxygenase-like lactoylglutathione lyase family enzyme